MTMPPDKNTNTGRGVPILQARGITKRFGHVEALRPGRPGRFPSTTLEAHANDPNQTRRR